jgi:hypothetical protein
MPDTTGPGAADGLIEEEVEWAAAAAAAVVLVGGCWERPDQRNTPRRWLAGLGEVAVIGELEVAVGVEEVAVGLGEEVGLGVSMEGASGLSLSPSSSARLRAFSSRAPEGDAASSFTPSLVLKAGASQDALKNLTEGEGRGHVISRYQPQG